MSDLLPGILAYHGCIAHGCFVRCRDMTLFPDVTRDEYVCIYSDPFVFCGMVLVVLDFHLFCSGIVVRWLFDALWLEFLCGESTHPPPSAALLPVATLRGRLTHLPLSGPAHPGCAAPVPGGVRVDVGSHSRTPSLCAAPS